MKVIVHLNAREEQRRGFVRKATICLLIVGFVSVVGAAFSPLFANSSSFTTGSASATSNRSQSIFGNPQLGFSRPRFVPGQYTVDGNTVALYHFDNPSDTVAIDETGLYTGTLLGNTQIASPGLYSGDLVLDTSSYVNLPGLAAMSSGTIEAFVDFSGNNSYCEHGGQFPIFAAYDSSNQPLFIIGQTWDGYYNTLQFSAWTPQGWFTSNTNINACRYLTGTSWVLWPYETWRFHHVAVTWGPRGVEMWVDGVLHALGINSNTTYGQITCNPQMQMFALPFTPPTPYPWGPTPGPWWGYPLCPAPVFSQTPVAGTYTGGLGPFGRIQLGGCYPGIGCYNGRLDEVRISNVQRTYDWWNTDPTSTPPPSPTSVALNGGYAVDSNTQRLFHLDYKNYQNTVYDEVSRLNFRAGSNTAIVGGRFNNSLQYGSNSGPTIMEYADTPVNGTVESWIYLYNASSNFNIFSARASSNTNNENFLLGADLGASRNLRFGMSNGTSMQWIDSGIDVSSLVGSWHHVAGTWGLDGMKIWIDGSVCQTGNYRGRLIGLVDTYYAGCGPLGKCVNGILDEIRVSDVARTFTWQQWNRFGRNSGAGVPLVETASFLPFISVAPSPTAIPHIVCTGN